MTFNGGDVVKLKSGSPRMTVKTVFITDGPTWTTGDVQCQWFSGNDILESTFKPDSLKKIDDATGIATFGGRLG